MGSVGGRFEVFVDPVMGHRDRPRRRRIAPPQRARNRLSSRPNVRRTRVSQLPSRPDVTRTWSEPAPVPLPTGGDAGEPAPVPLPTGGDTGDSAAPRPAGDAVVGGAGSSSAAARSRPCLISAPNQAPAPVIGSSAPRRRAGPDGVGSRAAAPTDLAPGQPDTEGAPGRPRPRDAICACATKSYRKSEAAGAVRAAGCGIRSGKVVAFTDAARTPRPRSRGASGHGNA